MANFAVVIYNKKQPFSNLKLKPFCLTHPRHTYAPLFMLLTMSKNRFLEFVFAVCFFFCVRFISGAYFIGYNFSTFDLTNMDITIDNRFKYIMFTVFKSNCILCVFVACHYSSPWSL